MEFYRIHKDEYFRIRGVRFQKKDDEHAVMCDSGVLKKFYWEMPVEPESDFLAEVRREKTYSR